jgi:hypothetical protein
MVYAPRCSVGIGIATNLEDVVMNRLPYALLSLSMAAGLALTLPGTATAAPTEERSAMVEERLVEVRTRLGLTDEQITLIEPIVADSLAQQRGVLERYGIDPETLGGGGQNFRTMRRMKSELDTVRADTMDQLQGILTPSQLEEFSAIQEERKAEMRARMRASR